MKFNYHIFFLLLITVLSACNDVHLHEKVTYSEHIASIIYKNCTPCHREGEAAPFVLYSYEDSKLHSELIKFVTKTRLMPPWPADASYTHFTDERVLTNEEIDLITRWVDEGCAIGDSTNIPPVPNFPKGSQLGIPDLVIKLRDPYKIKGNRQDQFLLMRVPYEIPEDKYITTIEVVPDNRKLLHHLNAQLLSFDFDKKKDVFAGNVVVSLDSFPDKLTAYKALGLANDDQKTFPLLTPSVTNYLPGVTPPIYPDGIGGYKLTRKGALFLNDIHYGPSRVDTTDQTTFNVFYAKVPPRRPTQEFLMGTLGIAPVVPKLAIPANEIKTFTSEFQVPFDISVLTVNPHMHLLGKEFWAFAVTLRGDTIPLIKINKWDFRWQYFYTFKKMVKIPKGAVIHIIAVFDNTRNNPNNPNNPPELVFEREGSMRTSDEMLQFFVTYLPYQPGDENISLERK